MQKIFKLASLGITSLAFTACTTTGNIERNAAGGAAAGAAIGAGIGAISGDVKVGEGAAAGAVVGGIVGAIHGNNKDKETYGETEVRPVLDKSTRYFDEKTGRYYYFEQGSSPTYYENYERRT